MALFLGINEFSSGEQNHILARKFEIPEILEKYKGIHDLKIKGHANELVLNQVFKDACKQAFDGRAMDVFKLFWVKTIKTWTFPNSHHLLNNGVGKIFKLYFLIRFLLILFSCFYLKKSSLKRINIIFIFCVTLPFAFFFSTGMFRFLCYFEPIYIISIALMLNQWFEKKNRSKNYYKYRILLLIKVN